MFFRPERKCGNRDRWRGSILLRGAYMNKLLWIENETDTSRYDVRPRGASQTGQRFRRGRLSIKVRPTAKGHFRAVPGR
jgi:hypothetical protein